MRTVCPALIAVALMLTGCASSGTATEQSSGATWWNPLSWSLFSSGLTVTEKGVGGLNKRTPMNRAAVYEGLGKRYDLRKGIDGAEGGSLFTFFQALDGKEVKVRVSGGVTVRRIDILDSDITTAKGIGLGTPFGKLYKKAFGSCQKGSGDDSDSVECKAPGSSHISYIFSGEWRGPKGLIPSDDALKKWTISKIIWRS